MTATHRVWRPWNSVDAALLGIGLLLFWPCPAAGEAPQLPTAAAELTPIYWKQRIFQIPYQFNSENPLADRVDKVRLLLARQATGAWQVLQDAQPHVRGFSYYAPSDGEYLFAVQMVDRRGNAWPSGAVKPQLRIVVDTQPPELQLRTTNDRQGQISLHYNAADRHLAADSLAVEVETDGQWSRLPIGTPDVSQPDRLIGRVDWKPEAGVAAARWRATIADRAGNTGEASATSGPSAPVDPFSSHQASSPATAPFSNHLTGRGEAGASAGPSLLWPADNDHQPPSPGLAALPPTAAPSPPSVPPPIQNPYTSLGSDPPDSGSQPTKSRVPAQFAADGPPTSRSSDSAAPPLTPPAEGWSPVDQDRHDESDRLVNTSTFEVEYDLQAVGRWGVARVALWGTRDGGQTWTRYAVDDDNRSPIRVTVAEGGSYGFRLLVDGANGTAAPSPTAGDSPELTVQVDLQKPSAELLAAEIGQGHLTDHLLVRWSASDTNLEPQPIGLFYSTHAHGPWSTAATNLANTGQYAWRLERHVPDQFYLRLEVRDVAGNVTAVSTPSAISLNRPQPMGRLRGVRPVAHGSAARPRSLFQPPPASNLRIRDQTAQAPGDGTTSDVGAQSR